MNSAISVLPKGCRFGFLVASAFLLGGESEVCAISLRIKTLESTDNSGVSVLLKDKKADGAAKTTQNVDEINDKKVFLSGQFTEAVGDYLKELGGKPQSFHASTPPMNLHTHKTPLLETAVGIENRLTEFNVERWDAKAYGSLVKFALRKIYMKLMEKNANKFGVDLKVTKWMGGAVRNRIPKIKPFMCQVLNMLDPTGSLITKVAEVGNACQKKNQDELTLAALNNLLEALESDVEQELKQNLEALIKLKTWEEAYSKLKPDQFKVSNAMPAETSFDVFFQESNRWMAKFLVDISPIQGSNGQTSQTKKVEDPLDKQQEIPQPGASHWNKNLHHSRYLLHFGFSREMNDSIRNGLSTTSTMTELDKQDLAGGNKWIPKMMADAFAPDGCVVDETNLIFAMMSGRGDIEEIRRFSKNPETAVTVLEDFYKILDNPEELKKLWIPNILIQDNEVDDQHTMVLLEYVRHAVSSFGQSSSGLLGTAARHLPDYFNFGKDPLLEIILQLPTKDVLSSEIMERYKEAKTKGEVLADLTDDKLSLHYDAMKDHYKKTIEPHVKTFLILEDKESINGAELSRGTMKMDFQSPPESAAEDSSTTNENNDGVRRRARHARHGARVDHGNLFDVGNLFINSSLACLWFSCS